MNLFNPTLVVLGGVFGRMAPFVAPEVEEALDRRAMRAPRVMWCGWSPPHSALRSTLIGASDAFEPFGWIRRPGSALGRGRSGWRAHDEVRRARRKRSGGLDKDVAYREAPSRDRVTNFGGSKPMRIPRLALWAIVAIVLAACTVTVPPHRRAPGAAAVRPPARSACRGTTTNSRWAATDQPNIKGAIEAGGGTYTEAFAGRRHQQLTDVENLINQDINVLILAKDLTTIGPCGAAANAGVPIIAYDRLVEDPDVLYISFDNVGVGEAEATAMFEKVPTGTYVLIKGDPGDPNASTFLPLRDGTTLASGKDRLRRHHDLRRAVHLTGRPVTAQNTMEAIIDAANDQNVQIDAVLAENDSTALGWRRPSRQELRPDRSVARTATRRP